jgi:hypothetical protein
MTEVRDFVAALARTGKGRKEIQTLVDAAYGDKTMSKSQINPIIKAVKEGKNTKDQCHLKGKKTARTPDVVAAVSATIENDRRRSIKEVAAIHGLTYSTVQSILTDDLGLVKKSARWVPKKLLTVDQKEKRVEMSREFLQLIQRQSMAVLDKL